MIVHREAQVAYKVISLVNMIGPVEVLYTLLPLTFNMIISMCISIITRLKHAIKRKGKERSSWCIFGLANDGQVLSL